MAGSTRRDLLLLACGAALGAGAGHALRASGWKRRAGGHLRPPGALLEDEFLATCIRCGQCAQACPYGTLHLSDIDAGAAGGTPTFEPRRVPCRLCEDHGSARCIEACPTGALKPLADFREARMGTAEIDDRTCLPYRGEACRTCRDACPFPLHVFEFDTQGRPTVNEDCCIGCGLCEHACPVDRPAIVVVPWKGVAHGA